MATEWFIYARGDDRTNEVIGKRLSFSAETVKVKTDGGIELDMWPCTHRQVEELEEARQGLNLRFHVYTRESRRADARRWTFPSQRERDERTKAQIRRANDVPPTRA